MRIFTLYRGFIRRTTRPGYFVKGSARIVEPPRIEYKGFKYRYSIKGDILRSYLVLSQYRLLDKSNLQILFKSNSGFEIKKKQDIKGKFVYGPISRLTKRKKFLSLFKTVV